MDNQEQDPVRLHWERVCAILDRVSDKSKVNKALNYDNDVRYLIERIQVLEHNLANIPQTLNNRNSDALNQIWQIMSKLGYGRGPTG